MQTLPIFRSFLLLSIICFSRPLIAQEFEVFPNGLIYSDQTMMQLQQIVDSLNLKFRVCDLDRSYRAKMQARAVRVELEGDNLEKPLRDLSDQMRLDEFLQKYPEAKVQRDLLAVRDFDKDDEGNDVLELNTYPEEFYLKIPASAPCAKEAKKGRCLYRHSPKNEWRDKEYLTAYYLETDFAAPVLPFDYARMVQYTECMIDTTTTTYLGSSYSSYWDDDDDAKKLPAVEAFYKFIALPEADTSAPGDYLARSRYRERRDSNMRANLAKGPEFKKFLQNAVDECVASEVPDFFLEQLAGEFLSKKAELNMKRCRRVMGQCSQDSGPRDHALDIAKLAAESASWEVFLRSHLDIMNDRFPRATDGSYAWGARHTYLRELEELELNIPELMIGVCLRVENPGKNHYFGNVGRVGRALSESSDRENIETQIRKGIADKSLDDFNRLVLYYLYRSLIYWSAETGTTETEQAGIDASVKAHLKTVAKNLPVYLAGGVD